MSGRNSAGGEHRRDDDARVLREAEVDDETSLLHIFAHRLSERENVLLVSVFKITSTLVSDFAAFIGSRVLGHTCGDFISEMWGFTPPFLTKK